MYSQYSQYPPAPGSVAVQPGQSQANTGGVSFEITPSTAQVFIDGSYVGTVGEFTPTTQPIGLTPGRHRIEIRVQSQNLAHQGNRCTKRLEAAERGAF